MEIIKLNTDNKSDYDGILDQDVAESIGREFYRGIVAVEDGNNPAGAMIWEYKNLDEDADTGAEICYIRSESSEATELLLSEFDGQASDEDVINTFFEFSELSETVLHGFNDDGFDICRREGRDIVFRVSDLLPLADMKKSSKKTVGLAELTGLQFMQGVTNCMFHGKKGLVEDLEYIEKEWFDDTTSCCVITDRKVSGMLLVHRFPSGNLMPVFFTAIGPEARMDLLSMIVYCAKSATENYPGDTPVIIRRHSDSVRGLVKKFFGERSGEKVLFGIRE